MEWQHFPVSALPVPLSSSGQVVVPEELRFPHTCCVGIASQTSLSLFNPSERWQQVAITVTSLAIDGEKVSRVGLVLHSGKEHNATNIVKDWVQKKSQLVITCKII